MNVAARPERAARADRVREFRLTIADLTLAMVADEDMPLRVDGALASFLADDAVPDLVVRARWGDLSQLASSDRVFDAGTLWQLSRDSSDRFIFRFSSPTIGPLPYKVASIAPDLSTGEVRLHRPYFAHRGPVYPLEYPLDELLLIQMLAAGRGAEVHSCGVVHPSGRGLVFLGQSGAGKTTIGRQWVAAGADVISDDRVVLRPSRDGVTGVTGVTMYGTPWHGDEPLAAPVSAPLSRLFFLRQHTENAVRRMGLAEGVARLLATCFPPFHDGDGMTYTMAFFESVVRQVPCYELSNVADSSVIDFVNRTLEADA